MRKVGLIAAAAVLAAVSFTVDGAFAQGKTLGGGGGGGGMRGGGAAMGGGGGMRGGGVAIGGGGIKGGMVGISPGGGGGGWAGRPVGGGGWAGNPGGGQRWAGRPGGWNGGWHGGHRRYWGPGIGFGTGLALGAFAASPYYYGYNDDYYYDTYPADEAYVVGGSGLPDDIAACRARYRSYDVQSQTFLGNDGRRHPCP